MDFSIYFLSVDPNPPFLRPLAVSPSTIKYLEKTNCPISSPFFTKISSPLTNYRRTAVSVIALIAIISLVTSAIISYTSNKADPIFGVPFMEMNGPTYLITAIILVVLIGLYITLYKIFGKDEKYEN